MDGGVLLTAGLDVSMDATFDGSLGDFPGTLRVGAAMVFPVLTDDEGVGEGVGAMEGRAGGVCVLAGSVSFLKAVLADGEGGGVGVDVDLFTPGDGDGLEVGLVEGPGEGEGLGGNLVAPRLLLGPLMGDVMGMNLSYNLLDTLTRCQASWKATLLYRSAFSIPIFLTTFSLSV